MIKIIDQQPILNDNISTSIQVTYPRKVNIIYGNYSNLADIENLKTEIKNNISEKNSFESNVRGHKTEWEFFKNHCFLNKFINILIRKHSLSHEHFFLHFNNKYEIAEAWGNMLLKGHYVNPHVHNGYHLILYLTEGSDLILPELNLRITPKPGDYYLFPPQLLHYVEEQQENIARFNLVVNLTETANWEFFNKTVINKNDGKK